VRLSSAGHCCDLEGGITPGQHAELDHRVHDSLQLRRCHRQRVAGDIKHGRRFGLDTEVFLNRRLEGGAVGVGDLLPLFKRLVDVGQLLQPVLLLTLDRKSVV